LNPGAASSDQGDRSTARLYRAALGPVRAEHYLAAFARFDERGRSGTSWNAAAAVFNVAWLIYRGLWGAAGVFAILAAVCAVVGEAIWQFAGWLPLGVKVGVSLAILLVLLALPGLLGTALLHAHIRQRMVAAVRRAPTLDAACEALQAQTCRRARRCKWALAGLIAGVLALGVVRLVDTAASASIPEVERTAPTARSALLLPTPLVEPAPDGAAPVEAPSIAEELAALAPKAALPASLPPESTGPAESAVETPMPEATTASPVSLRLQSKGYGVAVGLFAVPANAERAAVKLAAAGLPVVTDAVESARGRLTRVRVGPFDNRAQADAAADRVRTLKLEARVYAP
jgi:cell division septation protein DedD